MSWYLAKGLVQLRVELKSVYPHRDTTSDGAVGDTSHQARKSDHNPDYSRGGVVRAIDVDKDGIEVNLFVEFLVDLIKAHKARCDAHSYVIFNHVIWTATNGGRAARYTGVNGHEHHVHFSICNHPAHYDSSVTWGFAAWLMKRKHPTPAPKPPAKKAPAKKPAPAHPAYPGKMINTATARASGALKTWQTQMKKRGWDIDPDGYGGEQTAGVCKAFKQEKKITPVNEVIDKKTWDAAWTAPRT